VAVVSLAVGAVTSSTARVIARVAGTTARLAVSESSDLAQPTWFDAGSVSSDGAYQFTATGLSPTTQYFYGVEDTGVLDTTTKGKFRTYGLEGTPWSHTVATIGDAGLSPTYPGSGSELVASRISNAPTFDTVRLANPDLVAHLGDLTYYDLGSGDHGVVGGGSVTNYRRMYTDVFAQTRQHRLYRETPWAYMWDNHDYGYSPSPGYPDGMVPGKGNAAQAYRERVPHYPTPEATGSPYQSWQMGRVLYILNDTRYNRSFTLDADSPTKTMLGEEQLSWMFNLLQTTTAEALVWLMPTPWLHDDGGIHHWGAFTYERDAIIEFLTTTPVPASNGARMWNQSLVQVTADIHALGLCSPAHNGLGGFPVMLTAGIDATPHHGNDAVYDLGYQGGREQWGTVGVVDDGNQIVITLTGWYQSSPWGAQSLQIETPDAVPPLPAPPPQFSEAAVRQEVTWLAVNRVSGTIIAELPEVECRPRLQLSAFASTSLSIPLTSDKSSHVPIQTLLAATDGRVGAVVAIVNDVPIWMGLPANRYRGTDKNLHVPSANTPESYLLKRLARDIEFVEADRSRVALALAMQAESMDGLGQGIGFEYDVEDTGELITIGYKTTDRLKIYNGIRDLCAQGLEFTANLDWADGSQTRISKVLKIARRIGVLDAPNIPVLDTDVSVSWYKHSESWADEDYANHITWIGPGQGDSQPAKTAIDRTGLGFGFPLVESVASPGNNIGDDVNLRALAESDLARRKTGVESLEIRASLHEGPLPCIHARLGDMLGHHLNGPGHPKPTVYDPTDYALIGSGRLTGIEIDPTGGTWTPFLVEDPTLEGVL
jgi:alkaline phosphatase D